MKKGYLKLYLHIIQDENLTPSDKIIYSFVTSCIEKENQCEFTNEVMSRYLKISEKQISRTIQKLHELGYITLSYLTYRNRGVTKTRRFITLTKIEKDEDLQKLFNKVYDKIKGSK